MGRVEVSVVTSDQISCHLFSLFLCVVFANFERVGGAVFGNIRQNQREAHLLVTRLIYNMNKLIFIAFMQIKLLTVINSFVKKFLRICQHIQLENVGESILQHVDEQVISSIGSNVHFFGADDFIFSSPDESHWSIEFSDEIVVVQVAVFTNCKSYDA